MNSHTCDACTLPMSAIKEVNVLIIEFLLTTKKQLLLVTTSEKRHWITPMKVAIRK
jgi:hypothetical protein